MVKDPNYEEFIPMSGTFRDDNGHPVQYAKYVRKDMVEKQRATPYLDYANANKKFRKHLDSLGEDGAESQEYYRDSPMVREGEGKYLAIHGIGAPPPDEDHELLYGPMHLEEQEKAEPSTGIVPGGVSWVQTTHAGGVAVSKGQLGFRWPRKKRKK